jgi:hypothetical protein
MQSQVQTTRSQAGGQKQAYVSLFVSKSVSLAIPKKAIERQRPTSFIAESGKHCDFYTLSMLFVLVHSIESLRVSLPCC